MAATEVIHFPLRVQLGPRLPFSDQIPFEPGRPFLSNLPPRCRCMLTVARCLVAYFETRRHRMNRKPSKKEGSGVRGLMRLAELKRGDRLP